MEALAETTVRMLQVVVRRHRALASGLAHRAEDLEQAALGHHRCQPYVDEMVEFVTGQVLPFASLEEDSLYAPGAAGGRLEDVAAEMRGEHDELGAVLSRISAGGNAAEVVRDSKHLAQAFTAHVTQEETLVLPQLLMSTGVDASRFVARMDRLDRGHWTTADLDVRGFDPAYRERLVLERFDALSPGRSFALVDDMDPDKIRRQLQARYGEEVAWELTASGPMLWRAKIGWRGRQSKRAA